MGFTQSVKLFASLFVLCLLTSSMSYAAEKKLTILHTNDHHGHFQKFNPYPVKDVGGLAAQSTLVNITRAEAEKDGGAVLVLSAGDVNTGVPESDLLDAKPDFKLMNMIGYDAMVLGNHEFDNSREVLLKQIEWAEFPILGANVVKKDTGKTLVKPYVIKDIGGLKVAILGLLTEETPTLVLPENVADLEFKSVVETAKKHVPLLRRKADLVIALTHIGLYDEGMGYVDDQKLAAAVPGIDIIVGGHTHTDLEEPILVGNTIIVQAGGYSESMGRLDLVVDNISNKVTKHNYELLSVNGKKRVKYNGKKYYKYAGTGYVEDKEILEAQTPFIEGADKLLGKAIGEASVELTGGKSVNRSQETNLGNLITNGMLAKTGAEIAFQNGGGIRAGIAPGTISYRDVLTVQPFGNTLVVIDMTGEQIIEVLNLAAGKVGSGAFMQVAGLKVTYNSADKKAENVMVGDAPIDPVKTYKVVTNNFVAAGGDGYKMLKDLAKYDTGYVDADATMEYIQNLGKVAPKTEGRITVK